MKTTRLTCIVCPLGCEILVEAGEENGSFNVKGNRCDRGHDYAVNEATDPRRVLTTTVRVTNGMLSVVPVKTTGSIPKSRLFDLMARLSAVKVEAPIERGQVVVKNVDPSGIDLVATRDLPLKTN